LGSGETTATSPSTGRLAFAKEDVDLIHEGIDGRQARQAGATLITAR
jgi:hypothetical protein